MIVLFAISGLNLIRGAYDFYQTFVNPNSGWGPQKVQIHNTNRTTK